MKRYAKSGRNGFARFGLRPHTLDRVNKYRGGIRL